MGVRLENYLFRSDVGTYREINEYISNDRVKVNGVVRNDNNFKVDAESDFVDIDGKVLSYRKYAYVMMNKPEGFVCAERDRHYKTVIEKLPAWCVRRGMKPASSLDKDMSGLVLLSDDISCVNYFNSQNRAGNLVYHVQIDKPVTIKDVEAFAGGMRMKNFIGGIATLSKDETYYKNEYAARITTRATKFYDISRMFKVLGIKVLSIELIAIGDLVMPIELEEGQIRELDGEEIVSMGIKNPYI